ncbi:MAG: hypothetical protein C4325_09630 [Blastocatellia bacterium]
MSRDAADIFKCSRRLDSSGDACTICAPCREGIFSAIRRRIAPFIGAEDANTALELTAPGFQNLKKNK